MKLYVQAATLEDKRDKENPYLYFTKHGTGPGTLPRDVNLMKEQDFDDYMTAIWVDRPLSTEELKQYDIYPETMNTEFKEKYKINSSSEIVDTGDGYDFIDYGFDLEDSNIVDSNIVLYVDGKKVYEGNMDDSDATFVKLCEQYKAIYDLFFRYCNSFGDDILEKGASAQEVGETTWDFVSQDYYDWVPKDEGFYEDFDADYHYNDPKVECFLKSDEV